MQEKSRARLRELAPPPRLEGARRLGSRKLAFAFSCMSEHLMKGPCYCSSYLYAGDEFTYSNYANSLL